MAKKKTRAKTDDEKDLLKVKLSTLLDELGDDLQHEAPEGFIKQQGDVSGFWVRCSPIQGIPRSVKLMDGRIEPEKSAALVLFELTKPCIIDDGEGEFNVADVGTMVGIWYKAGMRSLRWLRDTEVWMKENPPDKWKDTGKGNAMITFEIKSKERGQPMLVLEDTRHDSAPFIDGNGKTVGLHDLEPKPTGISRIPI